MRVHHLPQGTLKNRDLILRERYTPIVPWHHLVAGPYSLLKAVAREPMYKSRGGMPPAKPRVAGFM